MMNYEPYFESCIISSVPYKRSYAYETMSISIEKWFTVKWFTEILIGNKK